MTTTTQASPESQQSLDVRTDALAALVTVTAEQMEDRRKAGKLIAESAHRTDELISLVFGADTPSVENYLASRGDALQAA